MSGAAGKLYTAEQVRRLDACAIGDHGIAGYELMKRAGQAAFDQAVRWYPDAREWLVLCGSGNNAGDAYVVAKLARNSGRNTSVVALKSPELLSGDALTAAQDWIASGGEVRVFSGAKLECPELLVDGLLGTGLDRPVEGDYLRVIEQINQMNCSVLALDIPSGLNADTGQVMGCAVQADLTISFIGLKRGLFTADGPDLCGRRVFNALSVPEAVYVGLDNPGELIREEIAARYLPARTRNSHKGHYGHVLVVGGCPGMPGAVRLCGEAALRAGAGLVSIATHFSHAAFLNVTRPELMVHGVEEAQEFSTLLDNASVLAVGPGMGRSEWSQALFQACIASPHPLVLDADGLNLLAEKPVARQNWVLTPHPAEAARLMECSTAEIQADRVGSAQALAKRYDATVVLKGCGTIVASKDNRYAICPLGNPGMATAGSGDVLTGLVAAFLGQGLDGWQAACLGVVVHAAAGDLGVEHMGQHGLLAGDIIEQIPAILHRASVHPG